MLPNYLKRELSILFFVINKKQTTTDEISQSLTFSKRVVKENLFIINKHFTEYLSIENFILSKKTGLITVRPELQTNAVSYAYHLKLFLLKNNVLFNYCVLLVTSEAIEKKQILEKLFISPSYLHKLTQRLNHFFEPFDFKVNRTNHLYSLEGNEMNIRLFTYLFLQDSFQDFEWPFPTISIESLHDNAPKELLEEAFKRPHTKNRTVDIISAILQIRISKNHYVHQSKSIDIQTFLTLVQDAFDITVPFQKGYSSPIPENDKKVEIQYLNVLSHIFISDIIPKKEKIKLGKLFFEHNHSFCTLSKEILLSSIHIESFTVSKEHQYLCMYYLTFLNAFYFLVGHAVHHIISLFIPSPTFHLHIQSHYLKEITDKITPIVDNADHRTLIATALYTLFSSKRSAQIKIYLQMIKDFTASYFIENRLLSLYNPSSVIITDDYSLADIIVTDTLERGDPSKKVFYLDSVNNKESWQELMHLIQQFYLDRQDLQNDNN